MNTAYICDAIRTPFGRYGGALASVRADDLAALPLKALIERNTSVDWAAVDDLIYGCANQAGEDNRNVARMAVLLAGLPVDVPATTVNRLCGSSMDAIAMASRAIKCGEGDLLIAGGIESMTRAPFVMAKSESAFARAAKIEDTTLGWRFINPALKAQYGIDSMPETGENVAEQFSISRDDQDIFAARSQQLWAAANARGFFASQLLPVTIHRPKNETHIMTVDEQPRPDTKVEVLAKLRPVVKPNGTVTAGNASTLNDGAAAVLIASEAGLKRHGLKPRARIVAAAAAGIAPRIMGFAPALAVPKVLARAGLTLAQMDTIELNEAFAAQALAVTRDLGLADDDPRLNPNGGAIAIGHPLGASGARLVITALNQLEAINGRYALCTMCIGVGQAVALIIERT
ncbi:MAG: 3-oxoadipyl-CoA thiolase [Acidobacteriota bacterium]|nr:3-oxoadipyl-CoA thiolase [Acidobacteriota bacterium]